MFAQYNSFGALFQETAAYIGLLIRKNMLLHKDLEEHTEVIETLQKKCKDSEIAYENIISAMQDKERQIEDLQGENASLKF